MKTIARLQGAEFLRACYHVKTDTEDFLKKTKVFEIVKELPELNGKETKQEKDEIIEKHSKEKIDRISKLLLDDYAEETYSYLMKLCILEDGEKEENIYGEDLIYLALDIITSQKMLDFFTRLMKSATLLGVV